MLSVHLRLVLHPLLFSPSFLFFQLFFLPETLIFTERYPAKPLCPQRSVICRVTPSYNWSSFCCFGYFIIQMSPGPELMCIETSWDFIFRCMGDRSPNPSLETYLAAQEGVWRCHRFEQSWEQLMAHPSVPCSLLLHGVVQWWAGLLTKAPTSQQVKGWERLQEPGTSFRFRNRWTWGTEPMCESHLWFLSLDQQKEKHELKLCLLQFRGLTLAMFFCQET